MNQILYLEGNNYNNNIVNKQNDKKIKQKKIYFLFVLFLIIIIICIIYLFFYLYNIYIKDKQAKNIANSFEIYTLYSNTTDYNAQFLSSSYNVNSSPFIIGILEIDKINLHYPILSYTTDDSLKISLCRFAGPMTNEIGNLCIAGHNYANNTFFGKLNYVDIGDNIKLYDLNGNQVIYTIFYKDEISNSNLDCTLQNTDGKRIVTLMTCNNLKDTRLILVAKE